MRTGLDRCVKLIPEAWIGLVGQFGSAKGFLHCKIVGQETLYWVSNVPEPGVSLREREQRRTGDSGACRSALRNAGGSLEGRRPFPGSEI